MHARLLIAIVFLFQAVAVPAIAQQGERFDKSELWIETAPGRRFHFDVELAVTPAQQAQGLMHRQEMPPDAGMLFLFGTMAPRSFWMKNTLIPLDMLFLDSEGRIINIEQRTKPLDLSPRRSAGPAAAVLELNGGITQLLGIKAGDRVIHKAFESADAEAG